MTAHSPAVSAELPGSTSIVVSLAAGAAAGAVAKTVIAPLDRTKIIFQISHTPYSWRAAFQWLLDAYRKEGFLSLWRGNSATMARIIPYAAVQFTAHEKWKKALGVDTPQKAQQNKVVHLIAGALAGVTSQSATYPLDLARARMAVAGTRRSLRDIFHQLLAREGAPALYRGYWPTVLGVIPYAGVSFFTYDTLKRKYTEHYLAPPGGWVSLCCGGAAGALGQTASYPLDIVRRRMQTGKLKSDGTYVYATISDTLKIVYKNEGWRGFFKGLSMNWVKGPVATGVSFATYDAIKHALRDLALTVQAS
ncbi:unnamed protein product [Plutella xylostella]|uniref:(diamondback moth) hypothetical protein n=1 Tax=Plutella xylostella TaxID=51655 RepID=A0A8S4F3W3_PLUXY|nr:mitochondrial coenzyme A transporter SLC25A42 [Plutella xylostella]CAG9122919.1 unnamed protein product [Plutella xylostella]